MYFVADTCHFGVELKAEVYKSLGSPRGSGFGGLLTLRFFFGVSQKVAGCQDALCAGVS